MAHKIVVNHRKIRTADHPRQATPDRAVAERVQDFHQTIGTPDIAELFVNQAARCCQCGTKPCNQGPVSKATKNTAPGCPLNTRIPNWLADVSSVTVQTALSEILTADESRSLTEEGLTQTIQKLLENPEARRQLRHAFTLAVEENPLPEFLGLVCPQAEELCEGGTSREGAHATCTAGSAGYKPITIGNIESLIGRIGRQAGWLEEMLQTSLMEKTDGQPKHVAIIGGGPGGLASVFMLRRKGYEVSLYSRDSHVGGLFATGLPGTKLDKDVVLGFEAILKRTPGITLHLNTNVTTAEMRSIQDKSDAIILGLGKPVQRPLNITGEHGADGHLNKGVATSDDFLNRSILANNFKEGNIPFELDAKNKDVVVIGGGDTAMDCAREAIRQGAKNVTILYRGPMENMSAVEKERERAQKEGVKFEVRQTPQDILIDGKGHVTGILCQTGQGEHASIIPHRAQLVINATGFVDEPNLSRKLGIPGLQQTKGGIEVDAHGRVMLTNGSEGELKPSNQFYAVGDMVAGARCLAVYAVASAKTAVAHIHSKLTPPQPL